MKHLTKLTLISTTPDRIGLKNRPREIECEMRVRLGPFVLDFNVRRSDTVTRVIAYRSLKSKK